MRAPLNTPVCFSPWISRTTGDNNGVMQFLAMNAKRASLLIENLSLTATLYFGFSVEVSATAGVALGAGRGVILDVICPQAPLYLFMDSATVQQCSIMEISYL